MASQWSSLATELAAVRTQRVVGTTIFVHVGDNQGFIKRLCK